MKRSPPSSPSTTDIDDNAQEYDRASQRRRPNTTQPFFNMGEAVSDLAAAWQRAHAGRGSPQDVALWRRYATVDPVQPWGLAALGRSRGQSPTEAVLETYETMWRSLQRRPALMRHLADTVHDGPTLLPPSIMDLVVTAYRLSTDDTRPSLDQIVRDTRLSDDYVRHDAVDDLVAFVDAALQRRDALERLGRGPISPEYPTALPPDAWATAVNALAHTTPSRVPLDDDVPAQGGHAEILGDRACDPGTAYYILVARVGAHPEGADDGLPDEGTYVFLIEPYLVEGRHGRVRSVALYLSDAPPFVDIRPYIDSRNVVPAEGDVLSLFLAAAGASVAHAPTALFEDVAGAAQVRAALVPLHGWGAIPDDVEHTFRAIGSYDRGWNVVPLDALSGVWITECQLDAAVRAFAGQVAARGAAPLFDRSVPTLFDAVADAIATGSHAIDIGPGALPHDVLERILPRVWQRTCSGVPTPSGTLAGAANLAAIAHALGLDVGQAASARPELLCGALAAGAIAAQMEQRRRAGLSGL
ncbi:hypothetical protein psal_cds_444 [Pandoravirus salinus]|uniref:Uncharacterized protein n=1 Tax=Pandoravirus salinus TaxID=1349410 RepID=S4VXL0_9VIRU|nr:hypothetical protein psal_cds_444 [Pandoravirus salinus]AGO84196.1 hypothetical protein psal_cds_444 [Pandoravirus salinus]